MAHRGLNTHDRLQKKCREWVLFPSVCCLCQLHLRSFVYSLPFCFELLGSPPKGIWSVCLSRQIDDWLIEALHGWQIKDKARVLWRYSTRALLWGLCLKRNCRYFEDKSTDLVTFLE